MDEINKTTDPKDVDTEKFFMPSLKRSVYELFTPDKKKNWYKSFRTSGNLVKSLASVGINAKTFYVHLEKDPYLKMLYQDALWAIGSDLEEITLKSARMLGNQGHRDRKMWLSAHDPKYRDKVEHEHTIDKKKLLSYYDELPIEYKLKTTKQRIVDAKVIKNEDDSVA